MTGAVNHGHRGVGAEGRFSHTCILAHLALYAGVPGENILLSLARKYAYIASYSMIGSADRANGFFTAFLSLRSLRSLMSPFSGFLGFSLCFIRNGPVQLLIGAVTHTTVKAFPTLTKPW